MLIQNLIFDLDGTLVDSIPGIEHPVAHALRQTGYQPTRDLRPLIGPPVRITLQKITGETDPSALDRIESAFRTAYDSGGWRRTLLRHDARETLTHLFEAGFGLYIVTNKPACATRRIVEQFRLSNCFRRLMSPDSASPRYGSKAEMLRYLIATQGVDPRRSLFVGDTYEDFEAASAVGMKPVLLSTGYGVISQTDAPSGARIIRELTELLSVLTKSGFLTAAGPVGQKDHT